MGTAAGIMGCLPSCSTDSAAATWAALRSVPIKTCVITDYGSACYSSKGGIEIDVDSESGK